VIDVRRLRQDAEYLVEADGDHVAVRLAATVLAILDDPRLVTPEGYALVKKPELLGIGVPQR
jgi:hypothetical protein